MIVDVIIPAINEESSIGKVITDIRSPFVRHVVVGNNGSADRTADVARSAGAIVVDEPRKGYGYACLAALAKAAEFQPPAEILVFLDGDYSDHPEELDAVIAPILAGQADLVIGSRSADTREKGAMTPQQVFGNWLATRLIRAIYGFRFTDLGPFRAIRRTSLESLGMTDKTYGWTVEMQVKALKQGLRCTEVPVRYRRRIGVSKVSGTVKGTILAGYKIITTILKYSL